MKKTLSLLLALALCLTLTACSSGTGNTDYDYILSLLDRGEYDMAIQVIEMLRQDVAPAEDQQREEQRPQQQDEVPQQSEAPQQNDAQPQEAPADYQEGIIAPGEVTYPLQVVLVNGTDYHFHADLINYTDKQLRLVQFDIVSTEAGSPIGERVLDEEECKSMDLYLLEPSTGVAYDDWHPNPAPFDQRIYRFTYADDAGQRYTVSCVYDLNEATTDAAAPAVDYAQDQGKDLATLRHDAAFEVEVNPGVYWVPARALGESRYTNAQIAQMAQNTPEEKRSAISTLYEALQLYQVGGFLSADDNVRIGENGLNWEHHKPGYYAVLTNCGCCATDSNWLHYILDGDYDEVGYVAYSQRDGNGHVFNYILQNGWYYVIDLTHYHAGGSSIDTAPESGNQIDYSATDYILGNIHKTQSLEAYAAYIQESFNDPPGLIVRYTASEVPAVDSPMRQDGSVEIVYAEMNDLDLQILYDDPNDSLTFRFESAPERQPDWAALVN